MELGPKKTYHLFGVGDLIPYWQTNWTRRVMRATVAYLIQPCRVSKAFNSQGCHGLAAGAFVARTTQQGLLIDGSRYPKCPTCELPRHSTMADVAYAPLQESVPFEKRAAEASLVRFLR